MSQQRSGNTLLNNAVVVMINKYKLLSSTYLIPVYNLSRSKCDGKLCVQRSEEKTFILLRLQSGS